MPRTLHKNYRAKVYAYTVVSLSSCTAARFATAAEGRPGATWDCAGAVVLVQSRHFPPKKGF